MLSKDSTDWQDFSVVSSTAAMLERTGQHEKAVKTYSKALEIKANDQNTLVARAQCHLNMGDYNKALADAEFAVAADKTFYKAILSKAEALFQKGDFEMAMVNFYRGKRLRPDIQEFPLGIQKAKVAIENAVGSPDQVKLTTKGNLAFLDKEAVCAKVIQTLRSHDRVAQQPDEHKRQIERSPAKERTVHQLLGELYQDKKYLERLLYATDDSTNMGKQIYSLAEDSLKYLDKCEDFWQQEKPLYSRRYDKKMFHRRWGHKELLTDEGLLNNMENIDNAQSAGQPKIALRKALKCLQMVNDSPDTMMTNKPIMRGQLHNCIGNAYLELRQYDLALKHHREDFNIAKNYEIMEGVCRSLDNIGRVHFRRGEYKKAIYVWESKLHMAMTTDESLWLHQELCRSYLALQRPKIAIIYAASSLEEAQSEGRRVWTEHAYVLLGQCDEMLGDLSLAVANYKKAMDLSIEMEDKATENTLRRMIREVQAQMLKPEEGAEADVPEFKAMDDDMAADQTDKISSSTEELEAEKKSEEDTSPPTTSEEAFSPPAQNDKGGNDKNAKVNFALD